MCVCTCAPMLYIINSDAIVLAEVMCPLVGNTMGQPETKMGIVKRICIKLHIKVGLDGLEGLIQPSWFCKSEEQTGGGERVLRK